MIFRIFSDYATSEILHDIFKKSFDIPCDIQFTIKDDYTHAIVINNAMPTLHVDPSHVVGLSYEPWSSLKFDKEYIQKHIGKYLCGESYNDIPFLGHYPFMPINSKIECITEKRNIMSIVFSEKRFLPGHKYRHVLVNEILKRKWPIDIYGKGCDSYSKRSMKRMNLYVNVDARLKGAFNEYEPYKEYMFTIVIENTQSEHYISEKVVIPLLMNSTPLYWGATEVDKYFSNMTIPLTSTTIEDLKIIENIIYNPVKYRKEINHAKLRKTINPFLNLDILF